MPQPEAVSDHYTRGSLIVAIEQALSVLGKTTRTVTVDDLSPVDEFHIGGREASEHFIDQLAISEDDRVLDVGCGIGGVSRFVASRYGCRVTGVDLTPEFVETAKEMNGWVGLDERISVYRGNALEIPLRDGEYDVAMMLHVGMNIDDKRALFTEVARLLKERGRFGIYDVMRVGDGDIGYPVPWAATAELNAATTPQAYRQALEAAGFEVVSETSRAEFGVRYFDDLRDRIAAAGGPPTLGLHIVMGDRAADMVGNMVRALKSGVLAPVELIARKA